MAATKSKTTLFNPEQTPTVYDEEGRTVGGAERVTVDEVDAVGQAAVDAGLLVREEESKKEPKGEPASTTDVGKEPNGSGASTPAKRA